MSGNLFSGGGEEKKQQQEFQAKVDTHAKALLTVIEKQKTVESSIELLRERIDMVDHNVIKNSKKDFDEFKSLREDIKDIKEELIAIREFNSKVTKQLSLMTTKDEVAKLERYIDLWNPMDFVTRDELKQTSKRTIDELEKIIESFLKD